MADSHDSGVRVLEDPLANKGTAFTEAERSERGLRGLLPSVVETLEQQVARSYQAYQQHPSDLARHINLRALQDTNETLFYRLILDHVDEMLPIIYTPTVGLACQRFSKIYRRPRGLFIAYPDRDRIGEILRNRPRHGVDVIVVTDGQRILGLGDQGIGGMGIPIGKLSLYTALGGIDPARTLPVLLDVGTDNPERLDDPMYLGWRHRRVGEDDYAGFVDQFVQAVRAELPEVLLQWEDFATAHALPILDRYRDQLLTFNDDIQGTAAVAVAALSAAAVASGSRPREQTVVTLGAGSAGIGVCEQIVRSMVADGLSEAEARARIYVVDVRGLLSADRTDLSPAQRRLAQPAGRLPAGSGGEPATFAAVVGAVRPTALIGLSTATGAFTEDIVRQMAAHADRPIILPLSNPTSRSEARPQDLADWTGGRALVATGSPFPAMNVNGRHIPVAQCNNVYIFPGVGLAVTAVRATRVTDAMMTAAATAVSGEAPIHHDPQGMLLPGRARLVDTATAVARAVARAALEGGVAAKLTGEHIDDAIQRTRRIPEY
ncbi:MAG TPA: NAD-dependent malic enzyme [Streptosporangiaceae bacterium]|jgi:malate dehydrogenase (oxaloacetate-decarboxylating)